MSTTRLIGTVGSSSISGRASLIALFVITSIASPPARAGVFPYLLPELLDPVPTLLNGNQLSNDVFCLYQGGTPVVGVAADAAAVVIIRIKTGFQGLQPGASVTVTLLNDSRSAK
jgi:hypothetical protein